MNWRDYNLQLVIRDVCFWAVTKFASLADMRRIAARQHFWAYSGLAASGLGFSVADLQIGASIVVT